MASSKRPTPPSPNDTGDTGDDESSNDDAGAASSTDTTNPDEQATPHSSETSFGHPSMNWMRQVDLRREHGWIGGVAAGIATRLAIDPLIVRGILVVVAILGGPAILLYAAAWLLVPDHNNSIHLEDLFWKKAQRAHAGIAALLVLSMLPAAQGFWQLGSYIAGPPNSGADIARVLWTILLFGGLIALFIWFARLARGSSSAPSAAPVVVPATTDNDPSTIPEPYSSSSLTDVASNAGPPPATVPAPVPAPATAPAPATHPPIDATDEEIAAWRDQRELWKAQNAAWKTQQQVDAQTIRHQRSAEARERAKVAAAAATARRRERQRLNPRLSAGIQAVVIGLALVGSGITAVMATSAMNSRPVAAATGLAVAALILGFAIVIGGALRHRSSFLGFVAGLTVLAALAAFVLPDDRTLALPSATFSEGRTAQLWGKGYISTSPNDPAIINDIWQGSGELEVFISEGSAVTFDVRSPRSLVCIAHLQSDENNRGFNGNFDCIDPTNRTNEFDQWEVTLGDPEATNIRTIRLWQQSGHVVIYNDNPTTPSAIED